MGWDEIVGVDDTQPDDVMARVILERSLDEQSFGTRKVIETLVDLACFSQTNDEPYYRHLLLLRELRERLSVQQDLSTFYGEESRNVEWSIGRIYAEIGELETNEIDFSRVWYAAGPLSGIPRQPGRILTSVRSRLQTALPLMHAHERLLVGLSYARAYGTISEDVHFRPQASMRDVSSDEIALGIDRVAIPALAGINRVQELLGRVPEGINQQVQKLFTRNTYPAELLRRRTGDRANVGDFVLASGDLCEVMEKRLGPFGYEIYRARYLAERPLPDVDEDWFLAEAIERFYTPKEFLRRMRDAVASKQAPEDAIERIGALPPEKRQEIIRESLVQTWEHAGLREWVRAQQREGHSAPHPYAPAPDFEDEE